MKIKISFILKQSKVILIELIFFDRGLKVANRKKTDDSDTLRS